MIFLLDKKEIEKINRLIETYHYNNEIADYLNNNVINNIDVEDCNIDELNINDYLNNQYYKNVRPESIKYNGYQIKYETYKPNQCFLYDEIKIDENDYFLIKNKIGFFNKQYKYLTIQKDNIIWMSVIPHEINTMKVEEKKLTKHIYVFGLGLGYFPYMISDKVERITIIEKDKNIINLFKEKIFPFFNHKEKYEIINDDAFNYIHNINNNDFVFVDLYHDVNDGLEIFIKFKKAFLNHNNIYYWINDSLLSQYRNILINLIEEELNQCNFKYDKSYNLIDEITNKLHFYFINKKISSYNDIKNLLINKSIEELIIKV